MRERRFTRRQVLKRATTASVGVLGFPYFVPASALGKAGNVAPSNRITMGVIGAGGMGMGNMKLFMKAPEVQIVAVCDVDAGSNRYRGGWRGGRKPARQLVEKYYAEKAGSGTYTGCGAYNDFRELLQRKDIDAVAVCTPDHWHALATIHAAKAGKDVYCEKPLANTVAEGRAMVEAIKQNKRVLQTGSQERSYPSNRFASELVRSGRLGKVHTIRVNLPLGQGHHKQVLKWNEPQPTMPVPEGFDYDMWLGHTPMVPYTLNRCHFWWRFILAYGGGEMTDRGAHVIDLGQMFLDLDDTGPVELAAEGKAPTTGIYDTFMEFKFDCRYANGVRLIGGNDEPRGIKFEGTDGWISSRVHGGRLEAEPASLLKEAVGPEKLRLDPDSKIHPRALHHRNFLDAVKSRGQTVAHAEAGHRTATICHLLTIAMQTGRKLKWDPAREQILNDPQANQMLARPMRSPWHL